VTGLEANAVLAEASSPSEVEPGRFQLKGHNGCARKDLQNARVEGRRGAKWVMSMSRLHSYTVVIRPDDNGTYVAYVPAIPGCHAMGKTPEEAKAELADVFDMIVEEYADKGRPLPLGPWMVSGMGSD
jgi:predicted RNase H-like HicB family nuclease